MYTGTCTPQTPDRLSFTTGNTTRVISQGESPGEAWASGPVAWQCPRAGGPRGQVDTVGTGDSSPTKGGKMWRMNRHVWQVTSASRPTRATQLTPGKGLAQNGQGNVQSLSLAWQKARLGSSPSLSGGQGKGGSEHGGDPAGQREAGRRRGYGR